LIYWLLELFLGMTTPFLIVLMAIFQQIFSFLRVQIRMLFYAGIDYLS
jgi:hypothetical protein